MTRFIGIVAVLISTLLIVAGCAPQTQMPQNNIESSVTANSEEHDFSVEIKGSEMKELTISQIASMWEIDAQGLLDKLVAEFDLKDKYTIDSMLSDLRIESKFSPSLVKEIAESIKKEVAR